MNKFNLAVLILLSIIILFQTCNFLQDKSDVQDGARIDTVFIKSKDTWHNVPFKVEVPVPYKVEVPGTPGATVTIPAIVDTMAIIADYFIRRHYRDSVKNDSIVIRFGASCYKNQLYDMKIGYRWLAPTMVITKTETVERQLAFIGLDVTGNADHFGLYPSIYVDTKRGMVGGGYDVINDFYKVGFYGKFKLWKKKRR